MFVMNLYLTFFNIIFVVFCLYIFQKRFNWKLIESLVKIFKCECIRAYLSNATILYGHINICMYAYISKIYYI